jgi:hypothetical protein
MILFIVAIYLIITFLLTAIGIEKQSEGLKIFIISFLLTPLAGLIFMLRQRRRASRISYFYCNECDYIFPVKMSHCPICAEQHKKIRLTRYVSPNDVTKNIKSLRLA